MQVPPRVADKHIATLAAEFALRGHALRTDSHAEQTLYIVSRWGQSRTFSHLNDVDALLGQIGPSPNCEPIKSFAAEMAARGLQPPVDKAR
jgi:hypothetical protein